MALLYLASLLGAMFCMGLIDYRWRLFLFACPRVAIAVVVLAGLLFVVWDVVAIENGAYVRGESEAMTGIEVANELPLEELFFITFLCYITGVVHSGIGALLAFGEQRSRRTQGAHGSQGTQGSQGSLGEETR